MLQGMLAVVLYLTERPYSAADPARQPARRLEQFSPVETAPSELHASSPSPISKLPPELLLHIFSYFPVVKDESYYTSKFEAEADNESETEGDLPTSPWTSQRRRSVVLHPWNWMNITYVCKWWQAVAYSSRSLWVCPPLYDAPWTRRSLELSDTHPIYIVSNAPREGTTPKNILRALQHVVRVREINLFWIEKYDFAYADAESIWTALQKSPAPLLEVLSIHPGATSRMYPPFPLDIFAGQSLSSLRELHLHNAIFQTSKLFFVPSLTSLRLTSCLDVWDNLEQMLDALSCVPKLQVLVLDDQAIFPTDMLDVFVAPEKRQFFFSDMHTVSLTACPYTLTGVLECVRFPSSAELTLTYQAASTMIPSFEPIAWGMARHFAPALEAGECFTKVTLDILRRNDNTQFLRLDIRTDAGDKARQRLPRQFHVSIEFGDVDEWAQNACEHAATLLRELPLRHGTTLNVNHFRVTADLAAVLWVDPIATLVPKLKTMFLSRGALLDFLTHLSKHPDSHSADGSDEDRRMAFPDLRVLTIERTNLGAAFDEDGATLFDVLYKQLESRSRAHPGEMKLSISICHALTAKMHRSLRALLGKHNLEWDGQCCTLSQIL